MIYIIVEKIRKLEINKLIRELDYIKSEYLYKFELLQEIDINFIDSVNSFLNTYPKLKEVFDESIKKEIKIDTTQESNTIPVITDIDQNILMDNFKLKSLYRSIVKSTHPDRIKDENLKELYMDATKAYESGDILPILSICDKLKIPYDVTDEESSLIKNEINSIKSKSLFLENTFTFKWYMIDNMEERNQIILSYIKSQLIR
jgi:hypothetical protein